MKAISSCSCHGSFSQLKNLPQFFTLQAVFSPASWFFALLVPQVPSGVSNTVQNRSGPEWIHRPVYLPEVDQELMATSRPRELDPFLLFQKQAIRTGCESIDRRHTFQDDLSNPKSFHCPQATCPGVGGNEKNTIGRFPGKTFVIGCASKGWEGRSNSCI